MMSNPAAQSVTDGFAVDHRRTIRGIELGLITPFMKAGQRILEVGAGAGWQAKILSERGFEVLAIDLPQSEYEPLQEWPVSRYDGENIPLPAESVDVVFSSNVLEHIREIDAFQREMQRVLKPGGYSIHVIPTATWRICTSITFYFKLLGRLTKRLLAVASSYSGSAGSSLTEKHLEGPASGVRKLFPHRHGERGNILTETYYFSELYWSHLFRRTGWEIESVFGNGLLYSGNRVFGHRLSIEARRLLSSLLGSSCKVYVLKRAA